MNTVHGRKWEAKKYGREWKRSVRAHMAPQLEAIEGHRKPGSENVVKIH